MAERRPLVAGLNSPPPDPELARKFVFGDKTPEAPPIATSVNESESKPNKTLSRAPLTSRVRMDYFQALKRASLERQLKGESPNTLQDILEEALEPWLKSHGYIT